MAAVDLQLPFEFSPNGPPLRPEQVQANFDYLLRFFNTRFKIDDTTGAITTPLQPGFLVVNTVDQTINEGGFPATTRITFDTEVFDRANNFASSIFTAPQTGMYIFTLRVDTTVSGAVSYAVGLRTTAGSYTLAATTAAITNGSLAVLAYMTAGDTADLALQMASTGADSVTVLASTLSFSGALIG
jgi:hypothetical protein